MGGEDAEDEGKTRTCDSGAYLHRKGVPERLTALCGSIPQSCIREGGFGTNNT